MLQAAKNCVESVALSLGILCASTVCSAAQPITLVMLGGGFLNGYGISDSDTLPALFADSLKAAGHDVTIRTASEDTTDGAIRWLNSNVGPAVKLLAHPADKAVIVELGPFDCAHQADPSVDHTRANLDQLLATFSDKHIPVLVVGTEALPWCSPDYDRAAYLQMFADLATKYGDALYPRFMASIDGNPDLIQGNGVWDPNAKGYRIIAPLMFPFVEKLVTLAEQGPPG